MLSGRLTLQGTIPTRAIVVQFGSMESWQKQRNLQMSGLLWGAYSMRKLTGTPSKVPVSGGCWRWTAIIEESCSMVLDPTNRERGTGAGDRFGRLYESSSDLI